METLLNEFKEYEKLSENDTKPLKHNSNITIDFKTKD